MFQVFHSKEYTFPILLFVVFFFVEYSMAQSKVSGVVYYVQGEVEEQVLEGASVYWKDSSTGTVTDKNGKFELLRDQNSSVLVFSFVGFETKEIVVPILKNNISVYLSETFQNQDEITIKSKKNSIQQKFFEPSNVLKIDESELLKAACCNLSEAFETNPAVDVYYEDALSGVKQIKLLGLESPYILITQENIPFARGATKRLGLSFIPGTWIQGMELSQGAGSVVNGFESMVGQINTSLKSASQSTPLFLNLFGAINGRYEVNTHLSTAINDKLSSALFLHGNTRAQKIDRNSDGFLDAPLSDQINFLHRLQYQNTNKGWVAFLDTQGFVDNKEAGQFGNQSGGNKYFSEINSKGLSLQSKLGYVNPNKPYESFGIQSAYSFYDQKAYWGVRNMDVKHQNYYANFIFQSIINSTQHKFKTGGNFVADLYKELVEGTNYDRNDYSTGVFFEYQYDDLDKFSYILGLRADYHNQLGFFVSPRLHLRYIPWQKGVFKLNIGQGRRVVNVFMENQKAFASSRVITVDGNRKSPYGLGPEIAWNYGLNFTQRFSFYNRPAALSLDLYRTDFIQQVLSDYERPQNLSFYQADQNTKALSFQIQTDIELVEKLNFKMAYKYQDIKYYYREGEQQKPFTPFHRFFFNAAYERINKERGWKYDITFQFNSKQRLPSTSANPQLFQLEDWVNSYGIVNTQLTRVFNSKLEWYTGAENLLDLRQRNPILDPDNPFGTYFDTTFVYAPVVGRMLYTGIRWKI